MMSSVIDQDSEPDLSEDEITAEETGAAPAQVVNANAQAASKIRMENRVPRGLAWKTQKIMGADGEYKHIVRAKFSSWVRNLVYLDGKPFDFTGRNYLQQCYDMKHPRVVYKTARQNEKSTLLANYLITKSIVRPYNKAIYCSPSYLQSRQFSSGKLGPWTADSPIISKYFMDNSVPHQVFERGFTNGSMIWIRSAFQNADRVRGLSGNELMLDEVQNMLSSNIPVILETLSHSPDPTVIFAGTPLSLSNGLEQLWQDSSQCEWLVKCHKHTPIQWNILDEKCIGKSGPICNKCGAPIDPADGQWISFSSNRDTMGFHFNQMQVPWMRTPSKWKELLWKLEHYNKGQFYNEVLGLSFDSASKPISRLELMRLCHSSTPVRQYPDETTSNLTVFAGIDWGEGADGSERNFKGRLKNASYTVLTLGAFINPKQFYVFFQKRYKGQEALPRNCLKEIMAYCHSFRAVMIGSDWGFGWGVNDVLEETFGKKRVIKFQNSGNQRERQKYDPVGHKVQLNRTEVMTDFFDELKTGCYAFPPWELMKDYLIDIEHIFAEYSASGLRYDHRQSEPDDAAHSIIYCREAARYYYQQF